MNAVEKNSTLKKTERVCAPAVRSTEQVVRVAVSEFVNVKKGNGRDRGERKRR